MVRQVLSAGCEADTRTSQAGVVHSVFNGAINLLIDGELWTVLDAPRADAPFGLRLAPGGRPLDHEARVADRVHVRAGYVSVGQLVLDCRSASRWAPTPWPRPQTGIESRLSAVERMARPRAWSGSANMAREVTEALRRFDVGSDAELAATVRRSVGRGPGLTPAGDDVLVGILTVLTSGACGPEGARAAARLTSALTPLLLSTSDVSRYLLDQAARGLPGRALHDLGQALVDGASDEVLAHALELVLDTGSTSGADACLGLAAAGRLSFLTTEKAAA